MRKGINTKSNDEITIDNVTFYGKRYEQVVSEKLSEYDCDRDEYGNKIQDVGKEYTDWVCLEINGLKIEVQNKNIRLFVDAANNRITIANASEITNELERTTLYDEIWNEEIENAYDNAYPLVAPDIEDQIISTKSITELQVLMQNTKERMESADIDNDEKIEFHLRQIKKAYEEHDKERMCRSYDELAELEYGTIRELLARMMVEFDCGGNDDLLTSPLVKKYIEDATFGDYKDLKPIVERQYQCNMVMHEQARDILKDEEQKYEKSAKDSLNLAIFLGVIALLLIPLMIGALSEGEVGTAAEILFGGVGMIVSIGTVAAIMLGDHNSKKRRAEEKKEKLALVMDRIHELNDFKQKVDAICEGTAHLQQ